MNTVSFGDVVNAFEGSENQFLEINEKNKKYKPYISTDSSSEEQNFTLQCLKQLIGGKRFIRICKRPELGIKSTDLEHNLIQFTENLVKKVYLGLLDIQKADLDEMDSSLSIQEKYQQLVGYNSFEEFEQAFRKFRLSMDHFRIDKSKTSGQGMQGLAEKDFLAIQHHFKVEEGKNRDPKAAQIRDAEMLTSRMADREIKKGSVFHLSDGYFYVDKIFVSGGAYVSVLRDLEGNKPPKLVCRGTALRPNARDWWKTGVNDILNEMGSWGAKSVWPGLSLYLRENKIDQVEFLGKSLGGAHAQELAVLVEGVLGVEVKKLVTVGSVGVGGAVNELFIREVLSRRDKNNPFVIEVIRNGGQTEEEIDFIPALGGVHLGAGCDKDLCDARVYYVQPGQAAAGIYPEKVDWLTAVKGVLRSLGSVHCRQTTLQDFTWTVLTDSKEVDDHLSKGKSSVNNIRECVAYLIDWSTAFALNGLWLNFYFDQQKELLAYQAKTA